MMLKTVLFFILSTFLQKTVFSQIQLSIPIGKAIAAQNTSGGLKLVDGNVMHAEVISIGSGAGAYPNSAAVWNENPVDLGGWFNYTINAANDPNPDASAAVNGRTLPEYIGSKHPEDFTRISANPSNKVLNAPGDPYANMVGIHVWFDRPVNPQSQFLMIDIDGKFQTNGEVTTVFGYNGTVLKKPAVTVQGSGVNKGIGVVKVYGEQVTPSWNTMIRNATSTLAGIDELKTTADADGTGNPVFVIRKPEAGMDPDYIGNTDSDELSTQTLFDFGSANIDHLFCLWGISGTTTNVQNSGFSPFVFEITPDLGDAPNTYGTLIANNGASHGTTTALTIGPSVTVDDNGQPSIAATDDVDNGVADLQDIIVGKNPNYPVSNIDYSVEVKAKNTLPTGSANRAKMIAWIDWNMNEKFDPIEADSVNVSPNSGTNTYTFSWQNKTVRQPLTNGGPLYTYMRIRLSTDNALTKNEATGPLQDGEVEDYRIIIREATILAVKGLELSAAMSGKNTATLNWNTTGENNNDRFNVQVSPDGLQFTPVASITAAGNSTGVQRYSFAHNFNPATYTGIIYYRIESVDKTGEKTYSNIATVKTELQVSVSTKIYPNPIIKNSNINIFTTTATQFKIFVYNNTGQLVCNKTITAPSGSSTQKLYELNDIAAGMYKIKVIDVRSDYTETFSVTKMK